MKIRTRELLALIVVEGLFVTLCGVANAQQPPKQMKPLPEGYKPDLAKPNRENKDVKADVQWLADREKIRNTVLSYSHLFDDRNFDEWKKLWTDDVVFENVLPGGGTVRTKGLEAFWDLTVTRYGAPSKSKRRHFQSNVHIAEQTDKTARILLYMQITTTPMGTGPYTPLTSGVYDGTLVKQPDGTWKISRWYILVDAPISPLDVTGAEDKIEFLPDPMNLPHPGAVLGPIKGGVTLKNHPLGSPYHGPLYQNTPDGGWRWEDIDVIIVDVVTDAKAAAAFLPENMTTFPIPDLPGKSLVKFMLADYKKTSIGPYREAVVQIPALHKGQLSMYVPFIYVDGDAAGAAMASGREMGGYPKKLAKISLEQFGNEWRGSLERDGKRLISVSSRRGSKLVETPLPADKPVVLPFPFYMTFPLPPPTGKPQEFIPLPLTSLRVIPGFGKKDPEPVVAELILANWQMYGAFYQGDATSVAIEPSETDPIYKLPVMKVLGALHAHGGFNAYWTDIHVLEDFLKK